MCWRDLLHVKWQYYEFACEDICNSFIYFHRKIPRPYIPFSPDFAVCGAHGPCCPVRRLDRDLLQAESDHSQAAGCLGAGIYLNQKFKCMCVWCTRKSSSVVTSLWYSLHFETAVWNLRASAMGLCARCFLNKANIHPYCPPSRTHIIRWNLATRSLATLLSSKPVSWVTRPHPTWHPSPVSLWSSFLAYFVIFFVTKVF